MDKAQRDARKAEQETARLHGGQVTPGSGSGSGTKNDVRTPEWSIEVKSTSAMSFGLDRSVLSNAEQHAMVDGRHMALVVEFVPKRTKPGRARRYVVMTEEDHLEREEELARLREDNAKMWSKIEADC